jgi:hypothetical protein
MSVQLSSLQFTPRGSSGWATLQLPFGNVFTLILGPNGSGKTPLVEGLAYTLGHPIALPPDIRAQCRSVLLSLVDGSNEIQIERNITEGLDVNVTEGGKRSHFSSDREFSSWLIDRLGIPSRTLTDRSGRAVPPYMSLLVPTFWIDQDLGWSDLYCPLSTRNFVKAS